MKRFKILYNKFTIAVLAIGLSLSSCDMDVTSPNTITEEDFWKTQDDATSFLNTIYRASHFGAYYGVYGDTYSDDAYCQYVWESSGALFQQNGLSPSDEPTPDYNFELIRRANILLTKIDECAMDNALRERMKAEARFLKAFDYLNKAIAYGKLPIINDVLAYNEINIARNSQSEVFDFIQSELTAVAGILPESYSGNDYGRVTKYAAIATKARAALYAGDYATAEAAAKQIMSSGKFSLFRVSSLTPAQQKEADEMDQYVDFAALGIDKDKFVKGMFSYESLWHDEHAGSDNPEYILTRQFTSVSGYGEGTRYTNMRPDQLGGGWSSVTPTQNLVNAYWTADGKEPSLYTDKARAAAHLEIENDWLASGQDVLTFVTEKLDNGTLKNYDFVKEFRNRDSRLYVSIMFPFKTWHETEVGDFAYRWRHLTGAESNNESKTGYNFRKMVALTKASYGSGHATSDWPTIRYAEILLTFAEARTQNTGFDSEVQAALNEIRDRCGMPNVPTSLSKEEGLNLIRNERRIELAAEGLRSKDISRYEDSYWEAHMGNVPIPSLVESNGQVVNVITMQWNSRMRLKPIYIDAIRFNPILKDDQNPGY